MKSIAIHIIGCLAMVALGFVWGHGFVTSHAAISALENERESASAAATETVRVRAVESVASEKTVGVSTTYQQGLNHVSDIQTRTAARIRNGDQRLSVAIQGDVCPSGAAATPADSAGRRDDAPRAELSATAAEALTALASDADAVVLQLTACQGLLQVDRATINGNQQEGHP